MRIIKYKTLKRFWEREARAQAGLEYWYDTAEKANWQSLQDVRADFRHADLVTVRSGNPVVVFNISKNRYRLITAIHFNCGTVYTLMVLTHAEYSKNRWKDLL